MILFCPCKPHPYQDTKYGQFMRVHNPAKADAENKPAWRCTVCGVKR